MRRPWSAAVITTVLLTTVLLAGAGCAGERPRAVAPTGAAPGSTATGPGGSGAPAVTSPGASGPGASPGATAGGGGPGGGGPASTVSAAGGNGREICAAALQTSSESGQALVTELAAMAQASGAGDAAGAAAARSRAEGAIANWAARLRGQSAQATDARLKAVLGELAAEVSRIRPDFNSIDQAALERLNQQLEQLCAA